MKRITTLNLILVVAYIAFYAIIRTSGFNTSVMFALPNVTYLFMTPIIGIMFLFNATLIVLFKSQSLWQSIFKWMSLVLLTLISLAGFTLPWTYITFGTSLMIFVQAMIITMSIVLTGITIYTIIKERK